MSDGRANALPCPPLATSMANSSLDNFVSKFNNVFPIVNKWRQISAWSSPNSA